MTENTKTESEFDWAEAARTVGASAKQVKFCEAVLAGCSNTEAARRAGYAGSDEQLRAAGYSASRSGKVLSLLALAEAGGGGVSDDLLTTNEARRILSRMARKGDANAKVRAIEALQRIDDRAAGADDYPDWAPDVTARRLCEAGGAGGALAAASVFYKVHRTLFGLPLGDKIVPLVRREFPEAFKNFLDSLPPGNEHHKPDILKLASGPIVPIGSFMPDGETTANGHSVTNGAATQASAEQHEQGAGLTFNTSAQEWERPGEKTE